MDKEVRNLSSFHINSSDYDNLGRGVYVKN